MSRRACCSICGTEGHRRDQCPRRYDYELRQGARVFLHEMDTLMKQPSTYERGRRIAQLCNALALACDMAEHFGKMRDGASAAAALRPQAGEGDRHA